MFQLIFVDEHGDVRNGGLSEYDEPKVAYEEGVYRAGVMKEKYGIAIVSVVVWDYS